MFTIGSFVRIPGPQGVACFGRLWNLYEVKAFSQRKYITGGGLEVV